VSYLPHGWTIVPLGEVISGIEAGKNILCVERPPEGSERGIVKISAVSWGQFNETESKTIPRGAEIDERARINPGDLLISRANTIELVGACVRVGTIRRTLYLSDKVLRLRAPALLLPWLHRYLSSPNARRAISAASSGNQLSMRNISQVALKALAIPIAPKMEQCRIREKLDAILPRIDSCRARLNRVPQILKQFRDAILEAAVSGRLTEEWRKSHKHAACRTLTVGDLCTESFYGPRFSKSEYNLLGIPTIRTTDMTDDGRIEITDDTPRVLVPPDRLQQFRVAKGDLLVTRTGSIGIMAVFEETFDAIPSAYLIRFRFNDSVLPRFMFYSLMSPKGQSALGLSATAITQPNVNAESIKRIAISLPDLNEQAEVVRRIDALFSLSDTLRGRYGDVVSQVTKLTPSVLAKAFRGELVPQDPNDEPAGLHNGRRHP